MTAWLHDGRSFWATLVAPEAGQAVAYQGGRRLAEEAGQACQRWEDADAPSLYDFGMTRTADQQYIWSGDKDTGPRWQISREDSAPESRDYSMSE